MLELLWIVEALRGDPRGASTRRCATTGRAGDNAAGEAGAGIAGRVALVVVHAFMNYDRGAIRVEERIRLAFLQRDRRIQYLDRQLAVLRDMELRHVAGMTMTPTACRASHWWD